jgi:hypothetical protein
MRDLKICFQCRSTFLPQLGQENECSEKFFAEIISLAIAKAIRIPNVRPKIKPINIARSTIRKPP